MSIYLDYNASAPIDSRVLDKMIDVYKNIIGNADSRTHDYGERARKTVENARKQVSVLLGVQSDEVFFTSGATEANNIAIQGLRQYANESGKKHIISTAIEHHSVLNTVKAMEKDGFEIELINPDHSGRIDADQIINKVRSDTLLVSVMHVNNETGVIQPVDEIGKYLDNRNVLFHVDATQSSGKLVEDIRNLKYDMLSCSAHKMMGPQGVGALVLRKKNYVLPPVSHIIYGGQQERGLRPGTIPVALVAGMGKACELACDEYLNNSKHANSIKMVLVELLKNSGITYNINGDQNHCLCNVLNIMFNNVSSEALMMSSKQYCCISNGSACTSNDYSPSYVLKAMGLSDEDALDSVRISWGNNTNLSEVSLAFKQLIEIVKRFQN